MKYTFNIVEKVLTNDGQLFDTTEQAETYITDKMCEEINEIIKKTETHDVKHCDLVKILFALAGTADNAVRLRNILTTYL